MRQDGLVFIEYQFEPATAVLIYRPGSDYVITDIIAYVDDISDGKAQAIVVNEAEERKHQLVRTPGGTWIDVCPVASA
jgi:hypothetical protein